MAVHRTSHIRGRSPGTAAYNWTIAAAVAALPCHGRTRAGHCRNSWDGRGHSLTPSVATLPQLLRRTSAIAERYGTTFPLLRTTLT